MIKHLILWKIQNMVDILEDILAEGSETKFTIKRGIMPNRELTE